MKPAASVIATPQMPYGVGQAVPHRHEQLAHRQYGCSAVLAVIGPHVKSGTRSLGGSDGATATAQRLVRLVRRWERVDCGARGSCPQVSRAAGIPSRSAIPLSLRPAEGVLNYVLRARSIIQLVAFKPCVILKATEWPYAACRAMLGSASG
jgi:hypothetical protein